MRKHCSCITINTDASFHPIEKVGGYAFYIVCDYFKIQKSGRFKTQPNNPEEAEIMAIGNAIFTLLQQPELPTATWLIINSDCLHGSSKIKQEKTELGKKVNNLRQQLIQKIGSKKGKNQIRHVKSHNGKQDARSWVNDWCDKDGNPLPPLDPQPLPFPKVMICRQVEYQTVVYFEKYGDVGTLLYTNHPSNKNMACMEESNVWAIKAFTDFHGQILIEIP